MFSSQSAVPNNAKVFRFDTGTAPRAPILSVPLTTYFPQAPQPLIAAASTYQGGAQVFLFGLVGGQRQYAAYKFDTATRLFKFLGNAPAVQKEFDNDLTAATTYRFANNGTEAIFAYDTSKVGKFLFSGTVCYRSDFLAVTSQDLHRTFLCWQLFHRVMSRCLNPYSNVYGRMFREL